MAYQQPSVRVQFSSWGGSRPVLFLRLVDHADKKTTGKRKISNRNPLTASKAAAFGGFYAGYFLIGVHPIGRDVTDFFRASIFIEPSLQKGLSVPTHVQPSSMQILSGSLLHGTIPRLIHQTSKTGEVPSGFQALQRSWIARNPGFSSRFWTDEDIERFVTEEHPDLRIVHAEH